MSRTCSSSLDALMTCRLRGCLREGECSCKKERRSGEEVDGRGEEVGESWEDQIKRFGLLIGS